LDKLRCRPPGQPEMTIEEAHNWYCGTNRGGRMGLNNKIPLLQYSYEKKD